VFAYRFNLGIHQHVQITLYDLRIVKLNLSARALDAAPTTFSTGPHVRFNIRAGWEDGGRERWDGGEGEAEIVVDGAEEVSYEHRGAVSC
jgi:galactose mutarotase-like enzyme